jgi:hypothetical protein
VILTEIDFDTLDDKAIRRLFVGPPAPPSS